MAYSRLPHYKAKALDQVYVGDAPNRKDGTSDRGSVIEFFNNVFVPKARPLLETIM